MHLWGGYSLTGFVEKVGLRADFLNRGDFFNKASSIGGLSQKISFENAQSRGLLLAPSMLRAAKKGFLGT
jgi:hypothetical protein